MQLTFSCSFPYELVFGFYNANMLNKDFHTLTKPDIIICLGSHPSL